MNSKHFGVHWVVCRPILAFNVSTSLVGYVMAYLLTELVRIVHSPCPEIVAKNQTQAVTAKLSHKLYSTLFAPVNKLVSLTWLMWALWSFRRVTLILSIWQVRCVPMWN